ncbi:MAG: symmetrical bis(5'-nucleosyl)-tetraphosphatase [Pseudomonadota bacterium]
MAHYAIGDIQGCTDELRRLLDALAFDPAADRVWFAGDLVNRGPDSVGALRLVRELGTAATTVLGNHDLHLLAVAHDIGREFRPSDTLAPILEASDRDELIDWLRHQPLIHHDPDLDWTLVHAGLPPQWDVATARERAHEVEAVLAGPDPAAFLTEMFGGKPKRWYDDLAGWDRLRYIVNAFTRMRYVRTDGSLALKPNGAPGTQPDDCLPWYNHPERASRGQSIVFGHWSTLGLHREADTICLDSGCLWGGEMIALRLDGPRGGDAAITRVPCPGFREPG